MRLTVVIAVCFACACSSAPALTCREYPTAFRLRELYVTGTCEVAAPEDGGATLVTCDSRDDAFTVGDHTEVQYASVADFVTESPGVDHFLSMFKRSNALSLAAAKAQGSTSRTMTSTPAYDGGFETSVHVDVTIYLLDGGTTGSASTTSYTEWDAERRPTAWTIVNGADLAALTIAYDDANRTITARTRFSDGGMEEQSTVYDDAGNWTSSAGTTRVISTTQKICIP